jgi:flagellar hook assembly protein FlgD
VTYETVEAARVSIRVFDAQGKLVAVLLDEMTRPGRHSLTWHGRDRHGTVVASGVYFVRMDYANKSYSQKIVMIK